MALFESRLVGAAHFLGSVLCLFAARLHGGGAGWDVGKCWDSSLIWLLPFALFESSIGAARVLGLFAANFSLGFFLSLCSRVVQAACSLGSGRLVCCKAGGGAGCFRFVGGARTIVRWNRVELRARDTEMT